MNATINLTAQEIATLIRSHILKVAGVEKITDIQFRCDTDQSELPFLEDCAITVVLKETL